MANVTKDSENNPAQRQAPGSSDHPEAIRARHLKKCFSNGGVSIEVLTDINLDLRVGETVAIVGASGIGKSTLLHILGTLERPDGGTLHFQGEEVFRYDDVKLAKFRNQSIGFVFQFHHLLPEFSALENTMMPVLINGMSRRKAAEAAEAFLVKVGLQERLNYRVGKLSGGEQQRVALARALVLRPAVLLADEPTGNLDKGNSEQVHELLLSLNQELAMTLVVVTHNMELSSQMSRQVTIVDGRLKEIN